MPKRQFLVYTLLLFIFLSSCAGNEKTSQIISGLPAPGGVEGLLTDEDGRPVEGAEVYFYTDTERKFRGPADFMAEPTGQNGRYITELPPGRYFAVARKRESGSISGNLQKGDRVSHETGPINVAEGKYERVDFALNKFAGNMLLSAFTGRDGGQGIKGVVKDRDGTPHARAYAFAYKDPKMAGKPDYVSEWTREDGVFVIYVAEPGTYYVGARTGFMGVPRPDEPYGRYEGARDHSVKVDEGGFAEGVDVVLKRFSGMR